MATRAAIGYNYGDGFRGVYHHNDGSPAYVGITLLRLYHFLHEDAERLVQYVIHDHPAGWSQLRGDWTLKPGYTENWKLPETHYKIRRPQCYCHGDRHYEADYIEWPQNECLGWVEWVYVINPKTQHLYIHTVQYGELDAQRMSKDDLVLVADLDLRIATEDDLRNIQTITA